MKSSNPKRNQDSVLIAEGKYTEPCNVGIGRQYSESLEYDLAYFKLHVNADATITYKDAAGNLVEGMAVNKGPVPYLMSEIHDTGGVTCFIIHNGAKAGVDIEMTSPVYTANTGIE